MSMELLSTIFNRNSEESYDPLNCSLELPEVLEFLDRSTGYYWVWCVEDMCFKSYDLERLTKMVLSMDVTGSDINYLIITSCSTHELIMSILCN